MLLKGPTVTNAAHGSASDNGNKDGFNTASGVATRKDRGSKAKGEDDPTLIGGLITH